MKNILGGIIGFVAGCILAVNLIVITNPLYPSNFQWFSLILFGSELLHPAILITDSEYIIQFVLIWIIVGIFGGLSASSKWNTLRTALWFALIVSIVSLASIFILDPALWTTDQALRNVGILLHVVCALIMIPLTLPAAIPVWILLSKIQSEKEQPQPIKIETKCPCGAIFKSNPLICSECGEKLREENVTSL